jgi:phosphate transport system protein
VELKAMALYDERLANDLAAIRNKVAEVGGQVDAALDKSVKAVLERNADLANDVILDDNAVNRGFAEIDGMCHKFLARHLPSAGHLRLISSILRLNAELERIGDHAATIAREALQLSEPPGNGFRDTIVTMAGDSQNILRRAIKAFSINDADLARQTIGISARVRKAFDEVFQELATQSSKKPKQMRDLLILSVVFSKLERVSARAENICEETLFAITGEIPVPRKLNVLFLDESGSTLCRLAEAVGSKTASQTCNFSSMGRKAGSKMGAGLDEFMSAHGLTGSDGPGSAVPKDGAGIADFDVVVSLEGPVRSYIAEQPFHTLFLNWDVGELPDKIDSSNAVDAYYPIYRELTVRIGDLVERLRGERGE